MTIVGMKRRIVFFLVNRILAGTCCFEAKRRLLDAAGFPIGEGTKVVGPVFCTGSLSVGRNCWIGRNLTVHGNGSLTIGDNCDIAPNVMFLTGGHSIGSAHRRAGRGEDYHIRVEDGCWICARAVIGKSITVRRGSVVAACACVMEDVSENTLVGGVPARKIRSFYETED